ncbi:MAG: AAA domain-containing protein [Saprospiraceae bacterium]|nr:AAA family ATPase [Saprospiraceae bacterium]
MNPIISNLLTCIELEEKEQARRYRLDQSHTLKQLKAEGLAIQPIRIVKKYFGYADYPELSFRIPYPQEINMFKDGVAIECFITGEEPIKGVLINLDGKSGELRLFAPDFPEWIEDDGLGIKLTPDTRTTTLMTKTLKGIEERKDLNRLFLKLHEKNIESPKIFLNESNALHFKNENLNTSQRQAVNKIVHNKDLVIVHGPPGTGKTTTLIEAIQQLVLAGEKVLVTAPSNTAVDNISKGLILQGINLLRVGNATKVDLDIYLHTPEGKLQNSAQQKEIKELKKRAEEFRRMALKYKRSFGKAEREQRNLLFLEVKNIRQEIKRLQRYFEDKLYEEASVVAGTPIGIYDSSSKWEKFSTLVMDEAGQCLEPLAWCVFPFAEKIVLAGDHFQLPPTVLSQEATRLGFDRSILEVAIKNHPHAEILDTQYRMKASIAGFSSEYFYNGLLLSAPHLQDIAIHITFIDTAGAGYNEKAGMDGMSLQNEGEINIVHQLFEQEQLDKKHTAIISPYSGQVSLAKERLQSTVRISTIDSFQGQEKENIILSLVRSNEQGEIGFLKDYRRMNVAITRAKERLYVIGDSATIGNDPFYALFLEYVERHGAYRTAWEFEL